MAPVRTTPLAKFRLGIGGRIDAGGGDAVGVSRVSNPAPAPKVLPYPKPAPQPPSVAQGNGEFSEVDSGLAATRGTPVPVYSVARDLHAASNRHVELPYLPDDYSKYLPTPTLAEWDYRTRYAMLGILEVGTQDAFHAGVPSSNELRLTPTKLTFSVGETSVKIGWAGSSAKVAVSTPRKPFSVESTAATMAVGVDLDHQAGFRAKEVGNKPSWRRRTACRALVSVGVRG